uniref:Drought induced 19 protein type zinc-binding domain-containing protein n=1 Tax=Glycine max TaxID=3847 RepID=A0A0R0JNS1_SOYBN
MTKEKPQALALRRKLDKQLKLELTNSSPRTWGSSIYGIGVDADDLKSDGGNYSVFNYTDEDQHAKSLFRCPFCDFEFEFSSAHICLEELCPMCDKKLGKDAIRVAHNSSPQKRTLKSDKSSILSGDSVAIDKKIGKGFSSVASDISNAIGYYKWELIKF